MIMNKQGEQVKTKGVNVCCEKLSNRCCTCINNQKMPLLGDTENLEKVKEYLN